MNTLRASTLCLMMVGLSITSAIARTPEPTALDSTEDRMKSETFTGLKWRSIGPALASGRVVDFAVDPSHRARYYVAVASGGIWKTVNGGTTFEPVFDKYGSYSIGCLTIDPRNPHVVWAGTGENNSQRSVSFGDGVYRTRDGGAHWDNLGLKESEHIGMIAIDPRDSDVVYVAAQGPLWKSGGERGLYKTTDGGATWNRVLHISDDTGVNEVHLDPRDPDVIYASSYQRRRHVWTLIDGGPESAIHKSTDGGKTWRKLTVGLPEVDLGRIGLDISPVNPDIVYAIIEAAKGKSGFYRSTNRGESWEKRGDYATSSPQYYNEIFCDPRDSDRVYALDTIMHVTEDGGKTFNRCPREYRHVDDHALWIDPNDTDYQLVGCDGGTYETFDRGANWRFMGNLPITQFYRVSVDNSEPFYNVFGGTQDNNSIGGPSRTADRMGIGNEHWFVTVGGDGYETQVDPVDPNTVYSLWQYGGLVRYDRRSGEVVDIKPRERVGDAPYVWNWDTPLIISPHSHTRLYVAANRLFRSDDRGESWSVLTDDLSRGIDRNALPVMGKIQSVDAVAKSDSTSIYGNCVSLCESPLAEGLIYVGTDDGLVHVTEDGGQTWRRIESFPTVPNMTYVSCLTAALRDADTVYAAFDNHKNGDFKPYLLRSNDRGRTWTSISGDLPARDIVYSVQQDDETDGLLFVGTEFGAYFTLDGGTHWIKLSGDLPTIAVRDIDIQRREDDVVLGTFGRGFYVLDDYSPLRLASSDLLNQNAALFPVKTAKHYTERARLGGRTGRGSQGASFFTAPNPPFGAIFTYYLRDKLQTRKERREDREKKAADAGTTSPYPSLDELRAEDTEREPQVYLVVRDADGQVMRRVDASRDKGVHRVNWDLRLPPATPVKLKGADELYPWEFPERGPMVGPGTYQVTLMCESDGNVTTLGGPESFDVVPLNLATFAAEDPEDVLAFRRKTANLQRAVQGAIKSANEAQTRIAFLRQAVIGTPNADVTLLADIERVDDRMTELLTQLRGDTTRAKRNEPVPMSINDRVEGIVDDQWRVTSPPTRTQRDAYDIAGQQFAEVLEALRGLLLTDLPAIEQRLESANAPWTPGRVPNWRPE